MKTLLPWILSGALAASLWGQFGSTPAAQPAPSPLASCSVDLEALELSEEQQRALEALCQAECARASDSEAQAQAKLAEFYAALARPDASRAELDGLVTEASELRARSMEALIEAVVAVRGVLDPDQVESLLGSCCLPMNSGAPAETCP